MMRRILQSNGPLSTVLKNSFASEKPPVRVTVTGAAGSIAYSLLFRVASGEVFGPNQKMILQLLELPVAMKALSGVAMELNDCAFPLVEEIICTDNQSQGFQDTDYALLVGSKARGPGMERADLLMQNAKIFYEIGKTMSQVANPACKTVVVGNPCNTNCLILSNNAKGIPKENFTSLTRLDHNRALHQIAAKVGCQSTDVQNIAIFGNHSPTMVPHIEVATFNGKRVVDKVDLAWIKESFIPSVQLRGAAIIQARGFSSAASAADATINHMQTWIHGSKGVNGGVVAMGIESDGSYGVPKGLNFSFPVKCEGGKYEIVQNFPMTDFYKPMMERTIKELESEKAAVHDFLQ